MRSRPFITLRLPEVVHPGETLGVELLLESTSETPIDFVLALSSGRAIASAHRPDRLFRPVNAYPCGSGPARHRGG
ncbi:uncharacterized protein SOCEGT47_033770 [Sorangium cellulosum]|uniref:Uncharacterized protein n=1 Tax=Sorangium cellulosum TaxID=56 RepID=A0A4P2Q1B5_SORCE|nr:hypothetical protein [Sorangium cellulosum]AUX22861.1 uncharacterized protein SOCEGT47_033770 [Sorangium cellulosum]